MFIDSVKIYVKSGRGGKGCSSFYRDKYTRRGIPDGGDGGRGADIILRADRSLRTLLDFQFNRHFYGKDGGHGSGKTRKGKDAPALVVRLPCGTSVRDSKTGCLLRDLEKDRDELLVARGGKGGRGNRHGRQASEAEAGQEKELLLDLKLIADAGIVGIPNAGKSSLISGISNARPEIAAYPFTTRYPVLGVARSSQRPFVIADIPGLIEGSHLGRGLGDKFLKHIERTKVLVHLIDMSGSEGRSPLEDYKTINRELKSYSSAVFRKPRIICANKMDLEGADKNLKEFKKAIRKKVFPISALKKTGLEELIEGIEQKL
jgi:GTP-binding protein